MIRYICRFRFNETDREKLFHFFHSKFSINSIRNWFDDRKIDDFFEDVRNKKLND